MWSFSSLGSFLIQNFIFLRSQAIGLTNLNWKPLSLSTLCMRSISRPRTWSSISNACVCACGERCMHSPASANMYMVLIVLLAFVCVRTGEQMGKLINGGSKISLSLSRSFILRSFFFCASNVCSDHVVIDSMVKSRLGEWSRKHVHTHTYTADFIGNGCLWSIVSQRKAQRVDKETQRVREKY